MGKVKSLCALPASTAGIETLMDALSMQIVEATIRHADGLTEVRIQDKAHILATLENDVTSVSFFLLQNAN